jgi:hypothetical protein
MFDRVKKFPLHWLSFNLNSSSCHDAQEISLLQPLASDKEYMNHNILKIV